MRLALDRQAEPCRAVVERGFDLAGHARVLFVSREGGFVGFRTMSVKCISGPRLQGVSVEHFVLLRIKKAFLRTWPLWGQRPAPWLVMRPATPTVSPSTPGTIGRPAWAARERP